MEIFWVRGFSDSPVPEILIELHILTFFYIFRPIPQYKRLQILANFLYVFNSIAVTVILKRMKSQVSDLGKSECSSEVRK